MTHPEYGAIICRGVGSEARQKHQTSVFFFVFYLTDAIYFDFTKMSKLEAQLLSFELGEVDATLVHFYIEIVLTSYDFNLIFF